MRDIKDAFNEVLDPRKVPRTEEETRIKPEDFTRSRLRRSPEYVEEFRRNRACAWESYERQYLSLKNSIIRERDEEIVAAMDPD